MQDLVPTDAQVVSDEPDEQVADTLAIMRRYVIEDVASPALQADSARIPATGDDIADVFAHVRDRMRFVADEQAAVEWQDQYAHPIVEILIRPRDMAALENPRGDCDDFTMYGAAHLLARGIPAAFATVAADPRTPDAYSHVYVVAYPSTGPYAGRRVPMDFSHGSYPGWETEQCINGKRAEWPISSGCSAGLAVLALAVWGVCRLARGRAA